MSPFLLRFISTCAAAWALTIFTPAFAVDLTGASWQNGVAEVEKYAMSEKHPAKTYETMGKLLLFDALWFYETTIWGIMIRSNHDQPDFCSLFVHFLLVTNRWQRCLGLDAIHQWLVDATNDLLPLVFGRLHFAWRVPSRRLLEVPWHVLHWVWVEMPKCGASEVVTFLGLWDLLGLLLHFHSLCHWGTFFFFFLFAPTSKLEPRQFQLVQTFDVHWVFYWKCQDSLNKKLWGC